MLERRRPRSASAEGQTMHRFFSRSTALRVAATLLILSAGAALGAGRDALLASAADAARKAEANRAYDEAARAGALRSSPEPSARRRKVPSIVNNRSFAGQFDTAFTPSDATLAIGPTRFIQLVNHKYAIYDRAANNTTPIDMGTLGELADASGNIFDPQIMWDPTTSRFYFAMLVVNARNLPGILYGYSKTASPNSDDDFCAIGLSQDDRFPNDAKLGDSEHLIIIGVNSFDAGNTFVGADLVTFDKPPPGTTCVGSSIGREIDLRNANGFRVVGPAPANGVDTWQWGYVVARNLGLPSNRLWLYSVRRDPNTGFPAFGNPKQLTLPYTYDIPPDAAQPGLSQKLETLDARPRQAVIARNPARGNAFSLWTNQVVKNGLFSAVRWLEVNPFPNPPTVRRSGLLAFAGRFVYNSAISPDRRVDGATTAFGDSFVIGYTVSSAIDNINPRISMASSVKGAALTSAVVHNAPGPYRDFACPNPGDICRWGSVSSAAPDPKPFSVAGNTGLVWLTNQFASGNSSTSQSNWRSWIWAAKP
jgi:hypothetical protein